MIVACPKCKSKYKVDDSKIGDDGLKLRCAKCQTVFKVMKRPGDAEVPAAAAPAPAPRPAAPPPRPAAPPAAPPKPAASPFAGAEILVATESQSARGQLENLLKASRLIPIAAADGIQALEIIKKKKPKAAILDVVLPKLLGFELCELVKSDEDLKNIPIILLAAQLNSHRFKRSPESLYNADGYLEIKDIPSMAINMLNDLLGGHPARKPKAEPDIFPHERQAAPPPAPPAAAPRPAAPRPPAPKPPPAAPPEAAFPPEEKEEHEKAKRLARIIVSDIQLYNQEAVTEGVRNNNIFELLAKDIGDARKLYAQRVPEHIRSKTNYLEDTLNALIEKKKQELGI